MRPRGPFKLLLSDDAVPLLFSDAGRAIDRVQCEVYLPWCIGLYQTGEAQSSGGVCVPENFTALEGRLEPMWV